MNYFFLQMFRLGIAWVLLISIACDYSESAGPVDTVRTKRPIKIDRTSTRQNALELGELVFKWRSTERDGNLFLMVSHEPVRDSRNLELIIKSDLGNILLQKKIDDLGSVRGAHLVYALRGTYPQLAVEYDHGGSERFLDIFDFRNGKVVTLIEEGENSFDVSAEIRPFGSDAELSKRPFRVLLTSRNSVLLTRKTSILEYKNGIYTQIGQYSTGANDTNIEKSLQKSNEN